MSTIKIELPSYVPNFGRQFCRSTRFVVGYYSGACFVKRGNWFDSLDLAKKKMLELQENGFDAHVIEIDLDLYLCL